MLQAAVFVDAGYLLAAGLRLLSTGEPQRRSNGVLDVPAVLAKLRSDVQACTAGARLLRIYWYDGALRGGQPTPEQTSIALSNDVKLRLGMVNSRGEQKEVDALIVTDLIELARNHSVSDAVVLAGDGDLRIGVQIAQTYGVRVHLIGIKPAKGNQSPELAAEVDQRLEWSEVEVRSFLSLRDAPLAQNNFPQLSVDDIQKVMQTTIDEQLDAFNDHAELLAQVRERRGAIPPELDRPALATLAERIGRNLKYGERAEFRVLMATAIETRFQRSEKR